MFNIEYDKCNASFTEISDATAQRLRGSTWEISYHKQGSPCEKAGIDGVDNLPVNDQQPSY